MRNREFDLQELEKAEEALKKKVIDSRAYSVFDLEWDQSFKAVKQGVWTSDYQKIADLTKKASSELATREKKKEMQEKHREYIESDLWQLRRKNFLNDKNWKCEDCGNKAQEAHHVKYDNFAAENAMDEFQDLVALCSSCHKKRHYERGDLYE